MDSKSKHKAKQIVFAREYRGYTKKQLCEKVSCLSVADLSKIERGFKVCDQNEQLAGTAKALDFPESWFQQLPTSRVKINFNHKEYC